MPTRGRTRARGAASGARARARVLLARLLLAARSSCARARRPRAQGDRDRQRSRPHRDHRARRGLRGARRRPADRDRARRRRRQRAHVRAGGDARHQPGLVRVRAHQHHRQADRALARRRPLRHGGLGRGVARPRRAAHRRRHALGRLRARAHQERPRRRVPPHAGARPDRHLRRRARLRPLRAPLPVEGHRVRAEEPRPPALQRHHAGHHRPARHLPDRGVRRQPQGHLPDGCHLHLVRAGLPVRRLRLLAQAVQRPPRGERAIPRRHRGRHGGDPARSSSTPSCGSGPGTASCACCWCCG